ncbi:MAG: nickel pincer cofactor biosynthesis protein LarC [Terriglobales bacterium]
MRLAYLDASSGISGDMLLAAALAAGAELDLVNRALARLGLRGEIEVEVVARSGVQATRLWLRRPEGDRRPLGAAEAAAQPRSEAHHPHLPAAGGPSPTRGRAGAHTHHGENGSAHRTLGEVYRLLDHAGLAPTVTARARAVFHALAQAEARVHGHAAGQPLELVHFHEVGQDDAIMDVVGTATALEQLGVERLQCSALNTGSGFLTCEHGRFPVPAPATLELLRGVPVYSDGTEAELVTPTGAALVRTLAQGFGPMPPLRPEAVGYGAGSYELPERPDLLRLVIGRAAEPGATPSLAPAAAADPNEIVVLEANLDDLNPQFFGYLVERALASGALDIFSCPAQMKKNRPGLLITILVRPTDADRLTALLLAETTTLGVRAHPARRTILAREIVPVETRYGVIRIKTGGVAHAAPEYEDCREAALRAGVPLQQVHQEALRLYWNQRGAG